MLDTRKVVGGACWAKAESVSRDAKRIYGAGVSDKWLKGTVLEVQSRKKDAQSKRSTTYIKALYTIGNREKEVTLSLQSLKAKNPTPAPNVPTVPTNVEGATAANEGDINTNNGQPPAASTANTTTTNSNITPEGDPGAIAAATQQPPPVVPEPQPVNGTRTPVSSNHGYDWYMDRPTDVNTNGMVASRAWKFNCQHTSTEYTPGCDDIGGSRYDASKHHYSPYDFFMAAFPKTQLKFMVEETNKVLRQNCKPVTSMGEVLKWLGVTLLITRWEFGDRASLWAETTNRKYLPAPNFGKTGMSRHRYDDLLRYMVWSLQPEERPAHMSHQTYRWMLVQNFVDLFNDHRKNFYSPSSLICVDESMSRWYGLGGNWINMGLPHYLSIDRKPEDGCEIQNAADGMSGIMMRLKLVKASDDDQDTREANGAADEDNGYVLLCYLC